MNYPKGINKEYIKVINHSNRGMSLEEDINAINKYYLENNIACIHKKPTPIQIVRVDYTSREKAVIKEAFFKMPSTTDYNGIYNGKYIDFEAKETNLDYFSLSNIKNHQINHLKIITDMKGVGFIIIRFNKYNETYLLFYKEFSYFIHHFKRKSIPYSYVKTYGYIINNCNYINIIDNLML